MSVNTPVIANDNYIKVGYKLVVSKLTQNDGIASCGLVIYRVIKVEEDGTLLVSSYDRPDEIEIFEDDRLCIINNIYENRSWYKNGEINNVKPGCQVWSLYKHKIYVENDENISYYSTIYYKATLIGTIDPGLPSMRSVVQFENNGETQSIEKFCTINNGRDNDHVAGVITHTPFIGSYPWCFKQQRKQLRQEREEEEEKQIRAKTKSRIMYAAFDYDRDHNHDHMYDNAMEMRYQDRIQSFYNNLKSDFNHVNLYDITIIDGYQRPLRGVYQINIDPNTLQLVKKMYERRIKILGQIVGYWIRLDDNNNNSNNKSNKPMILEKHDYRNIFMIIYNYSNSDGDTDCLIIESQNVYYRAIKMHFKNRYNDLLLNRDTLLDTNLNMVNGNALNLTFNNIIDVWNTFQNNQNYNPNKSWKQRYNNLRDYLIRFRNNTHFNLFLYFLYNNDKSLWTAFVGIKYDTLYLNVIVLEKEQY